MEEELAVVDAAHLGPLDRAEAVLQRLGDDFRPWADRELKACQIETMSPVCENLDELDRSLRSLRRELSRAGDGLGCRILAAGTHPTGSGGEQQLTESSTYLQLEDDYRRLTDEQLLFGCHIHVGIEDRDLRIAVLDRVRPWLSVLLALSANSPYWEGADSGYASYRYLVFSRWPTFGTPEPLGDWNGYQRLLTDVVEAGPVDGPSRLYWTLRPSGRYPTLEFRICDVSRTVEEAVVLAGVARALAMRAMDDDRAWRAAPVVRGEVLRSAEWQAARYGLTGDLVDPVTLSPAPAADVVGRLLTHIGPALERAGDADRVIAGVSALLSSGNGAEQQRRSHQAGGMRRVLADLLVDAPEPVR